MKKECLKFDEDKPKYALLPPVPLEEVVKVYTFGAKKYEENNWRKGMRWSRTFSAIMRHCWAFWKGETFDPETKLHHMAHAAFGCLTLIEYTKTKPEFDDRVDKSLSETFLPELVRVRIGEDLNETRKSKTKR